MVLTNLRKKAGLLLGAVVVSFMMIGCGGGSSNPVADTKQYTEISDSNADQVIASTVASVGGILDTGEDLPIIGSSDSNLAISTEKFVSKLITSSDVNAKIIVAESGSVACTNGGSYSYTGDATSATVTFDQCTEGDRVMNGTMTMTLNDPAMTVEMIDFSIVYTGETELYYEYVKIEYSDIYDVNSDFSITMTGTATVGGETVEVENYSLVKSGDSYRFSGLISSACMGGWVEITTTTPLTMSTDGCPESGEIVVSGENDSELTITFNSDQSVDVSVNGEAYAHYNNCEDMPSIEVSCP